LEAHREKVNLSKRALKYAERMTSDFGENFLKGSTDGISLNRKKRLHRRLTMSVKAVGKGTSLAAGEK